MDQLKDKIQSGIVVIATVKKEKIQLIVGVSKDLSSTYDAVSLVRFLALQCGGKGGGGRAQMAQAGGTDSSAIEAALAGIDQWIIDQH